MTKSVRIGARGSELSRIQARMVGSILEENDFLPQYHWIKNTGDMDQKSPLFNAGEGVFVDSINESLLKREIDIAVHSAKDLPAEYNKDLELAYVTKRGDPRDTLVSKFTLKDMPVGSTVGTSSTRRKFQLLELRQDLKIENLRGNIGTRISRINSEFDGIVMARVAIERLKLNVINHPFSENEMVPSPNQGFVIGMTRKDSDFDFLKTLNPEDRKILEFERYAMGFLGLGCSKPIGILVKSSGSHFRIQLRLFDEGGKRVLNSIEHFNDLGSLKEILTEIKRIISG